MRIHRKQFIVSSQQRIWSSTCETVQLGPNCWLTYDSDLSVSVDPLGGALLLGLAIPVLDPRGDGALKSAYCGRYVSIAWPYLDTDASALLPIYYGEADGDFFCTSSPALAKEIFSLATFRDDVELVWNGINWVPAPGSRVANLRKLFCDQRIELSAHRIEKAVWRLAPHADPDEAAKALAARLVDSVQAMANRFDTLYLGLTAGLDSRTFLAALVSSGVVFKTITHSFLGVDKQDVAMARRLSSRFSFPHMIVTPDALDDARLEGWRAHTADSVADADAHHLVPGNHYRFLGENDLMIRGNCVEICRRWYDFKFRKIADRFCGEEIWKAFDHRKPDKDFVALFDEWIKWRRSNSLGLDLIESFYLDQRVGGWAAPGELGYDALDGHSIQAINSLSYYSDLISDSNSGLRTGEIQKKAINILCPDLLNFEINPIGLFNFHKRGKYIAKKIFRSRTSICEKFTHMGSIEERMT